MYCGKCGSSIPDEAQFCPICGKVAKGVPTAAKVKKPKKKLIMGLAIAVVVVVIAVVLALILIPRGPEKMLVDFGLALYEGDFEEAWDAANFDKLYEVLDEAGYLTDEYYIGRGFEWICDTSRYDRDDVYNAFYDYFYNGYRYRFEGYDEFYDEVQDSAEDYFGDDWEYDYEITGTEEMSDKELRNWQYLIDGPDGDFDVSEGAIVKAKITIEGEYEKETVKIEFYALKVDGEWIPVALGMKANGYWEYITVGYYLADNWMWRDYWQFGEWKSDY